MALLGYARTSTTKQNIETQITELTKYGCKKVFTDQRSGKNTNRDGLTELLKYAREGDSIVVYTLDRLARSIRDLQNIAEELQERGIHLVSITQQIDTSSAMGKLVFSMIGAFAEFERELIVERVNNGIQNAKDKGVRLGRRSSNEVLIEKAWEMYQSGEHTMREITDAVGLGRSTVYRHIEKMKLG